MSAIRLAIVCFVFFDINVLQILAENDTDIHGVTFASDATQEYSLVLQNSSSPTRAEIERTFFVTRIFEKYGNGGKLPYEGLEKLLGNLGLLHKHEHEHDHAGKHSHDHPHSHGEGHSHEGHTHHNDTGSDIDLHRHHHEVPAEKRARRSTPVESHVHHVNHEEVSIFI